MSEFRNILKAKLEAQSSENNCRVNGHSTWKLETILPPLEGMGTFRLQISKHVRHSYQKKWNAGVSDPCQSPAPAPGPQEKWLNLTLLSQADHSALRTLIEFGAVEFCDSTQISLSQLKRAHRRLAKKLHPDTGTGIRSSAQFREMHESYLKLRQLFS